eukprot:TRINITY_DN26838_c0_g1_i1.p1 TRINITY_DN26838_c0_g1~~TRINITY_DN26838_c0_g1_i1.p1  ORF type:complete len:353 (+),score=105.01 TRINITY_DN26838_c0_g1_i1:52-1059(+)
MAEQIRVFRVPLRDPSEDLGFDYECDGGDRGRPGIVKLVRIAPGLPLHRAGVPPGILRSLGGVETTNVHDLQRAVRALQDAQATEVMVVMQLSPPTGFHAVPPAREPLTPAAAADLAAAAEEEALALRLQRLATLRRLGVISAESYMATKRDIVAALESGSQSPRASTLPQQQHSFVPPSPWARVSVSCYVYLRDAPHKGAGWTGSEGVHGVLRVSRLEGAFALVRSEKTNATGYIQQKYISYMPAHWRPGRGSPGRRKGHSKVRLSAVLTDDDASSTDAGGGGAADRWAAHRSADRRSRSVGPPLSYSDAAPHTDWLAGAGLGDLQSALFDNYG